MKNFFALTVSILIILNLVGCSFRYLPEPLVKLQAKFLRIKGEYTVKKGETITQIARKLDMNYKQLAKINSIKYPYVIRVGQTLKIESKKQDKSKNVSINNNKKNTKRRVVCIGTKNSKRVFYANPNKCYVSNAKIKKENLVKNSANFTKSINPASQSKAKRNNSKQSKSESIKRNIALSPIASKMKWSWPIKGMVIDSFYSAKSKQRGINIAAKEGVPVYAAASGKVVYSGNALRGYGNLIIIKHDSQYLSAYAHNKKNLVKEGQNVKCGQQIAQVGKSGVKSPKLHFEIRYNGKPIDPLRLLPKK